MFDLFFRTIQQELETVPYMSVWAKETKEEEDGVEDVSQQSDSIHLPVFHQGPSPYIIRVKENLLSLPPHLEPLSRNPLFRDAVDILETKLLQNSDIDVDMGNKSSLSSNKNGVSQGNEGGASSEEAEEEERGEVVLKWVELVMKATSTIYLQQVLCIRTLSDVGREQLSV
tara:strand:+ start:930 stop:1442 length:513 start_codon:yes stop_codon:yes gene_type:complete